MEDRRILDNQYLFSLTPTARRWYELMAGKIFGVVSNRGEYCEVRYSWYIKHHHTLKRLQQRFRAVEQIKRVVRDHIGSGYLSRVELRALKEPDQEIDYLIRFYPGPGAKQSNERIQHFIRERRNQKRQRPRLHAPVPYIESQASQSVMSLSVITAVHRDLTSALMLRFGINPLRAVNLALNRSDVAAAN